ncbi:MAG: hypothetical protein MI919_07880, partial [Holophagales bacterium]|nr:hypothetical protein [Holophagales bacterium]
MSVSCEGVKASILHVSVAGKGLKAETAYPQTAVRVKNTGGVTWSRGHAIKVWLSIGSNFRSPAKEQTWARVVSREVKPGQSLQVRIPGFRAPAADEDGSARLDLIAFVTCGPGGSHQIARWRGRFAVSARFEAALVTSQPWSLEPLERKQLAFRFRNVSSFTFPGGEPWRVRVRVDYAPRKARREHKEAFELELPLSRWGRGDVEPGQQAEAVHRMDSVPPVPGHWDLEVTLMRGRQPFEPCAGTPEQLRCRIARYDPLDVARAEILDASLEGKTVVGDSTQRV